jgi:hypothetical protein
MGPLNNPKAIADELAILNHPLTAEERPAIVELVGQLHAADGIEEYFDLHLKLLAHYLSRQRVRGELEATRIAVRDRIRDLVARTPKPLEAIRGQQDLLDRFDRIARVQVALGAHTRAIADGLVWKALRYDRAAITILGDGTRVDRLADDGIGLQAELHQLGVLWEQNMRSRSTTTSRPFFATAT